MAPTFVITERTRGDVAIVSIRGDVTPGQIEGVLSRRMLDLVDQGYRKLVLDLEGLPSIDSIGLGEIVRSFTSVTRKGARMKLAAVPKRIVDLLRVTRLILAFDLAASEDAAVAGFQ
ncbi:MAG: STAS domain-containing protein [Vicinamibacterales bacterium]